jgi:hypothetical protein
MYNILRSGSRGNQLEQPRTQGSYFDVEGRGGVDLMVSYPTFGLTTFGEPNLC